MGRRTDQQPAPHRRGGHRSELRRRGERHGGAERHADSRHGTRDRQTQAGGHESVIGGGRDRQLGTGDRGQQSGGGGEPGDAGAARPVSGVAGEREERVHAGASGG
jgi:hypothetical protein